MLSLFKKYRLVLKFIFVFLGSYFLFSSLYNGFLILYDTGQPTPDPLTRLVAKQSGEIIRAFGYQATIEEHSSGLSMKLIVENNFLAGIVEGCNSASIIILFMSFVLAFFGKTSVTWLYILAGSVIIYVINLLRIVVLALGIYEYPEYSGFMHSVFFPLAIYGTVFILWLIWVRIYSKWKRKLK